MTRIVAAYSDGTGTIERIDGESITSLVSRMRASCGTEDVELIDEGGEAVAWSRFGWDRIPSGSGRRPIGPSDWS